MYVLQKVVKKKKKKEIMSCVKFEVAVQGTPPLTAFMVSVGIGTEIVIHFFFSRFVKMFGIPLKVIKSVNTITLFTDIKIYQCLWYDRRHLRVCFRARELSGWTPHC